MRKLRTASGEVTPVGPGRPGGQCEPCHRAGVCRRGCLGHSGGARCCCSQSRLRRGGGGSRPSSRRHDLRILRCSRREGALEGTRRVVGLREPGNGARDSTGLVDRSRVGPQGRGGEGRLRRHGCPSREAASGEATSRLVACRRGRSADPSAAGADAAAADRNRLDAGAVGPTGARHAGAIRARLALLPRGLAGRSRRRRQHGSAGCPRHVGCLRLVGLSAVQAPGPWHTAPVLRGLCGGHHARQAGQVARRPVRSGRRPTPFGR